MRKHFRHPQARQAIVDYIGWCNGTRLHNALGYRCLAEFENNYYNKIRKIACPSHQPVLKRPSMLLMRRIAASWDLGGFSMACGDTGVSRDGKHSPG